MINYKHLHYFWAVAREGGVARASERLHLTHPKSCRMSLDGVGLGVGTVLKNLNLYLRDRPI